MNDNSNLAYNLDASPFIEAYQRYYGFDICPGFWECLIHYCRERRLKTIDKVRSELVGRGDELSDWVSNAPQEFFESSLAPPVTEAYRDVMRWVYGNNQFYSGAKDNFSRGADGWLVAYTMVHGGILVTHEAPQPNARRRVPLPSVCNQFGVVHRNTFQMLRELDVRFDWRP